MKEPRQLREITVKAGKHASSPSQLRLCVRPTRVRWEMVFRKASRYTARKPENQHDWLKAAGLSGNLTSNHVLSFMCASRYMPTALQAEEVQNMHQVGPYCHVAGSIIKPEDTFIFEVTEDVPFFVDTELDREDGYITITITQESRSESAIIYAPEIKKVLLWREISTWFGGDETPVQDWKIWKSKAYKPEIAGL